jgi:hypothetical protein
MHNVRSLVTCALELTGSTQSAKFDQMSEVASGRGRRRAGERDVLAGGEAADESIDPGTHEGRAPAKAPSGHSAAALRRTSRRLS